MATLAIVFSLKHTYIITYSACAQACTFPILIINYVYIYLSGNTNTRWECGSSSSLKQTRGCPLFHLWTVRSPLSQQPSHCNQSFPECHYRLFSYFKAALLLSAICFAHRPSGGAEGEVRKPPLAPLAAGDSFTNPDWNTTINYGAPLIKVGRIEPAKQHHGCTVERSSPCDCCKQAPLHSLSFI